MKEVFIFNMRWFSEFGILVLPALKILMLCDDYSLFLKRFEFLGPDSALGEKDKRRKKKDRHTIGTWCDVDQSFLGVFLLSRVN